MMVVLKRGVHHSGNVEDNDGMTDWLNEWMVHSDCLSQEGRRLTPSIEESKAKRRDWFSFYIRLRSNHWLTLADVFARAARTIKYLCECVCSATNPSPTRFLFPFLGWSPSFLSSSSSSYRDPSFNKNRFPIMVSLLQTIIITYWCLPFLLLHMSIVSPSSSVWCLHCQWYACVCLHSSMCTCASGAHCQTVRICVYLCDNESKWRPTLIL